MIENNTKVTEGKNYEEYIQQKNAMEDSLQDKTIHHDQLDKEVHQQAPERNAEISPSSSSNKEHMLPITADTACLSSQYAGKHREFLDHNSLC